MLALFGGLTSCATSQTKRTQLYGQVVSVADGDTLTMLDQDRVQHRVRIDGIDAPERTQPYSQVARRSLVELAQGKRANAECKKRDPYERHVCKVLVDGRDVGLELVRRGLAWHFKRYAHEQSEADRAAYTAAELDARYEGRGLWRDAEPKPPWVFRKEQR
jgi:endonuclease YncB( thermonuclease family)